MEEVQGILHVQPSLPLAAEQDDRLPDRDDFVCVLRVGGHGSSVRCVLTMWNYFPYTADKIWSCSDYVKQQSLIQGLHSSARVHNDDFVGIAAYNIFVGIYVATIFGSGFFFDLFWPERHESKSVRFAWKFCSVFACVLGLADALALTVIVAKHRSTITANTADQLAIAKMVINPPLSRSFQKSDST